MQQITKHLFAVVKFSRASNSTKEKHFGNLHFVHMTTKVSSSSHP